MRLFEVDAGGARQVLAVLQGQADKHRGQSVEVPFGAVMRMIKPFDLGISTPDGLIALKNEVDPAGDVIDDILDDGTVILNTRTPSELKPDQMKKAGGPSVDQMAKSNTDLTPNI